MGNSSK